MRKSISKMSPEELQTWLHLNRKAHPIESAKKYNRKKQKKIKEDE